MNELSELDTASTASAVPVKPLSTSYRFDTEMARLLTAFQYNADGITLTAAHETRPLPTAAYDAPTVGIETVFDSDASLVFIRYSDRQHRMANPIEAAITSALTRALTLTPQSSTAASGTSGEPTALSLGVVTPHNAQRGLLSTTVPSDVDVNTVEKYQGGQRDVIIVSATVSDPNFARREERFILDPRRLLVAISRSKRLTIVICSDSLFEIVPGNSDRLDDGPVWARLFALAAGREASPAWSGSLAEFTDATTDNPNVPTEVYSSTGSTTRGLKTVD